MTPHLDDLVRQAIGDAEVHTRLAFSNEMQSRMALDRVRDHLGQDGCTSQVALFRTEPPVRMAHDEVDQPTRAQHLFADRMGLGYEVLSALDDVGQEVGIYFDDRLIDIDGR